MSSTHISPSSTEWSMLSLADIDPFPSYEELRGRGPVVWDPGMNCWLVLSHDICKNIESDEQTYRIAVADAPPIVFEIKGGRTSVSSMVGDDHARMRRLYLKLLGPAMMGQYRQENVVPVINDAIDRFIKRGHADLAQEFADVVPARIGASMFGLPWKDDGLVGQLAQWHEDIISWLGRGYSSDDEFASKAKLASDALTEFYRPLVIERRDERGSDIISQIWTHAPELYGPVGVDEVISIVRDIELGAGDTTSNAIANAFYLFLSDPALRDAVTHDQEGALNAFIEETLRILGSVQWRFRVANRDVQIGGATIKMNDRICLLHAAANRDPEHYACPHAVDLERKSPTDHLAFNVGPRTCLGMWLARLEMRESMKSLIDRLPNVRLDPAKVDPHFRAFSHRSFGPLLVQF